MRLQACDPDLATVGLTFGHFNRVVGSERERVTAMYGREIASAHLELRTYLGTSSHAMLLAPEPVYQR